MPPSSLTDGLASVVAGRRGSGEKAMNNVSVDALPSTSRKSAEEGKRTSNSSLLAANFPNGVRSPSPSNGVGINGVSSEKIADLLLPNGLAADKDSGLFGRRSHSSTEARSGEKQRQSENQKPTKLASRDDGYFAEAPVSTKESDYFLSSTHVSLSAMNEDAPTPPQLDGTVESKPKENGTTHNEHNGPDQETASVNGNDTSTGTVSQISSRRTAPLVHRMSSPPTLQPIMPTNPNPSLSATQPGNAQLRHTLEVPRLSTSRVSRETLRTTEDTTNATGRFSPISNVPTHRRASVSLIRKVTRSGQSDLHLDDAPPSEDADRWAEIIRQRRASKRRKREDDDEDRVVMGTKVDQNHVNYVIAYNMLTGIRFTVSRTNAKVDRELTDADFHAKHKFSFDITGNELTPSAKYDFKFKDYAPWVFRHLRNIFRLDPADYLMSLTSKYILSELGSPGKSGSFFYFSRDYKYIIKTIHHAEHKVLRKILKEYYEHVTNNPNTLLSQFYGLHRVKIPYGRKIHFVVMNNLFPPHRDIHNTFDLKGSTVGRDFKESDLDSNPRATLKDLNWLRRNMHLELGPIKKHAFIEQMQRDVSLLQKLKIMDYSLLVGIHDLSRGNEDKLRDKTLQVFQPGGDKHDDQGPQIAPIPTTNTLMRTPSKLESQRKAKELRETLMNEKPVPMGLTASRMPEEMSEGYLRKNFFFYSDDGGFRATHEDNSPGEQIYYLGIIDCLTHYGLIKRIEHFWKSLGHAEPQISAVPPERYSDRFIHFISGITKSKELADLDNQKKQQLQQQLQQQQQQHQPESSLSSQPHQQTSQVLSLPLTHSPSELVTANGPSQRKADAVVERAEHQAATTSSSGHHSTQQSSGSRHPGEAGVPDRMIKTVQSPSPPSSSTSSPSSSMARSGLADGKADGGSAAAANTTTLPVVEEVGESGSVGGRSARSSVGVLAAGDKEEQRPNEEKKQNVEGRRGNETTALTNGNVGGAVAV